MNKIQRDNSANLEVFASNFSRFLAESGKSQSDIARALGVATSTVSDWKAGRAYPRMEKIQALAEIFGITKSDLVEERDLKKEAAEKEIQEIVDLFHQVPRGKREFVLTMIRTVIDTL